MDRRIEFRNKLVCGTVALPLSKSISNRVLLLWALMGKEITGENLSDSDDTERMVEMLTSPGPLFQVGNAGTVMRFLAAYLAQKEGKWEITGSDRMRERPVKALVEALNSVGAKVSYTEKEGFPPLRIDGRHLTGGIVEVDASVSSQYVSALMMIAPYMEAGLTIRLAGEVVSAPYIKMTALLMSAFGVSVDYAERTLHISPQPYSLADCAVEADWTSAAYFYELLSVAEQGIVKLSGLKEHSVQGDAAQRALWKLLGVNSVFVDDGVVITGMDGHVERFDYDFSDMPDPVQAFVVACCLKNIPFRFSGLKTLRYKETDRIRALLAELSKLGFVLSDKGEDRLEWTGERCEVKSTLIETYGDHRMAMAFAPAAYRFPGLVIRDYRVVRKSFPGFWNQFISLSETV